jgi:hypothetical protein
MSIYTINTSASKEEPKEDLQAEQVEDEVVEIDDTNKVQEPAKEVPPVKEETPKKDVVAQTDNTGKKAKENKKDVTTNSKPKQQEKPVNKGPVTYKSSGLGISFDMPRSWENNYVIKDNGTEIKVYMKHERNSEGAGYLFTITSNIHDYSDGMYLDSIDGEKKKTINGRQYLVGGPLDFRMDDNDPRVKTYKSMVRECGAVLKTLRAA